MTYLLGVVTVQIIVLGVFQKFPRVWIVNVCCVVRLESQWLKYFVDNVQHLFSRQTFYKYINVMNLHTKPNRTESNTYWFCSKTEPDKPKSSDQKNV